MGKEFFIALALIGAGVIVTLTIGATEGTVVIVTGFGLMVLTQFEWHEIKLLGMEAKLRDTINDAEKVLESLRKVSLPISEVAISLASRTGRFDTATSNKDLYKLVSSISSELEQIGVKKDELTAIKHDWFYFTTFDMCSLLSKKIITILQDHHEESSKIYHQWVGNKPITDTEKQLQLLKPVRDASAEIEEFRKAFWKKPYKDIPEILKKLIDDSKVLTMNEKQKFWKTMKKPGKAFCFLLKIRSLDDQKFGLLNKLKGLKPLSLSFRFISVFNTLQRPFRHTIEHLFNLFGSGNLFRDNNIQ
ncbi:TPA: hypothetical protein PCB55_005303 [Klebsiella quasipneumoniae]|nr:hypothetical protein [Klebsiella quasipneumoniae]